MNFSDMDENLKGFYNFYEKQLQSVILPDRLDGNYTVKNCLKQSEHREIYLLEDAKENLYVLKKQSGKLASQLIQEQQIFELLANIEGLAIPQYLDCWKEQDCCYLLRTYIRGCSLSYYYEHCPHLSDMEVIHYMLGICHLVSILHRQHPPIIHRDIKPENFIIEKGTGILYLVDFDTARVYTPDKSRDTTLIGTPAHAAPEQFGFSQSDVRTDIYALGKTLLYLTYGNTDVINIKSSPIAKPFQKIILHCTDFAPDKRYSDIRQLIRALTRYQRKLRLSASRLHRFGTAAFLLAIGICLGYAAGPLLKKQPPYEHIQADTNNSSHEGIPSKASEEDNPATASGEDSLSTASGEDSPSTASGENNPAAASQEDNSSTASGEVSLFEQSGTMRCDLTQFQDMVDQIIRDYYNYDLDALAKDCEELTEALYADEALNQISGTDYAGSDQTINLGFQAPVVNIRDALAYRNQQLKHKIGFYDNYKDAIYMNLNGYLDPTIIEESSLYIYATSTGNRKEAEYQCAIFDILNNLRYAFDMVDETENAPQDS